jgi:anti-sigma B factor antagonist
VNPGVIETEAHGDAAVVRIRSDIDMTVADPLRRALTDAVDRYGNVVLDLADAPTLDSAGLGALVRAHKHARHADAVLCFAGPSRYVVTVLHTMKVDGLFPTFDDCPTALDWLTISDAEPALG